jgi:hypothetical protein
MERPEVIEDGLRQYLGIVRERIDNVVQVVAKSVRNQTQEYDWSVRIQAGDDNREVSKDFEFEAARNFAFQPFRI